MNVGRWHGLGLASALGVAALASLVGFSVEADARERPSRTRVAETTKAGPTTHRLYGTTWHSQVEPALAAAAKSARKPVLVLRVLGAIDGKT